MEFVKDKKMGNLAIANWYLGRSPNKTKQINAWSTEALYGLYVNRISSVPYSGGHG